MKIGPVDCIFIEGDDGDLDVKIKPSSDIFKRANVVYEVLDAAANKGADTLSEGAKNSEVFNHQKHIERQMRDAGL